MQTEPISKITNEKKDKALVKIHVSQICLDPTQNRVSAEALL